ncbi:chymotrypsin-1-like [Tubulanus polymorphus]|uniref:chymotrypsin-1-like n=1 Tax=Tubulanus polymorphus TaxID=672921 RepID=UPI003DA30F2A
MTMGSAWILLLAYSLYAAGAGSAASIKGGGNWRIINGYEAGIGQFPYQISLRLDGNHRCGGVILDATTILCAAHCYTGQESVTRFSVATGIIYSGNVPARQVYPVVNLRKHVSFRSPNTGNDIMIIKLGQPIRFDQNTKPATLPSHSGDGPAVGSICTVSGWGLTDAGVTSQRLLYTGTRVQTVESCRQAYNKHLRQPVFDTQICTGGDQRNNACFGDSGGPLTCVRSGQTFVDGVVSWGPNACGTVGIPGIYTRLASYLDWIEENRH